MRILYVEDNEANQALVERVVRARRHTIQFRDEGEGALELLTSDSEIDLVLLDIELAGAISGIEVVKTLRASGDKRPIVAVTAYAMMGDRERILEAGCDQYLPKPLIVTDLLHVMDFYEQELAGVKPAPAAPVAEPAVAAPPAPAAATPTPAAAPSEPAPAEVTPASSAAVTRPIQPAPAAATPTPAAAPSEPAPAPAAASSESAPAATPSEPAPAAAMPTPAAAPSEPVPAAAAPTPTAAPSEPSPPSAEQPVLAPVTKPVQPADDAQQPASASAPTTESGLATPAPQPGPVIRPPAVPSESSKSNGTQAGES